MDYRKVSFWLETCGDDLTPRPALTRDHEVDTLIVGAGFTGLWTAWALKRHDADRRIAVVERDIAGFGASGRNGGWASALFPLSYHAISRRFGKEAPARVSASLISGLNDFESALLEAGIDGHYHRGGELTLATNPAHIEGIERELEVATRFGFADRYELLDEDQTRQRVNVPGAVAALYDRHCAVIQPARVARELARVLERTGVVIFEQTGVTAVNPGSTFTRPTVSIGDRTITAHQVVLATEAFTVQLPGLKRTLVPIYSLITLTEPISDEAWQEVGWENREAITDGRHLLVYLQRTQDGRILFGGRGAPYRIGSKIKSKYDVHKPTIGHLHDEFRKMFPSLAGVRFTHAWGGAVGASRDWMPSVTYDRPTHLSWARGYAGDGVAFAHIAGRTLGDLLTEQPTKRTSMPWVGHVSPQWPPEPFRLIGSQIVSRSMRAQDSKEEETGKALGRKSLGELLLGRNR